LFKTNWRLPSLERVAQYKNTCQKGLKYVLVNGNKIRFWWEVWLGDCPLRIRFRRLFGICIHQNWVLSRVLRGEISTSLLEGILRALSHWSGRNLRKL
jgi:hypothetical protein